MNEQLLRVWVWQRTARAAAWDRIVPDEAGEGVISAAIAVLVMAFLGVLMWELFKGTLTKANSDVNSKLGDLK